MRGKIEKMSNAIEIANLTTIFVTEVVEEIFCNDELKKLKLL